MSADGTGKNAMVHTPEKQPAKKLSLPQMVSAIGARLNMTRAPSTDEGDSVSVAETLVEKPGERLFPCI